MALKSPHDFNAWNPGILSDLPRDLLPKVTLYRPENSGTSYQTAREAADLCGRKPDEMVCLKVSRLVVHELLIRVSSDLHVPDGPNYSDLGVNLRGMVARILTDFIHPKMPDLERDFAQARARIAQRIDTLLEQDLDGSPKIPAAPQRQGVLARFFAPMRATPLPAPPTESAEFRALRLWSDRIARTEDALELACLKGLHLLVGGIVGQRQRLNIDPDVLRRLVCDWVCNSYGSALIGQKIDPILSEAAAALGYRFLPCQTHPFILNVKGASAAGKSTLRPLQRELAERLEIPWEDFALISPDYWRKFLLDYESLGEECKYAAMLTGAELEIIDRKLDHYMREKALRGQVPHMLIDRFRFDSFQSETDEQNSGALLSRFGDTVYLFFMITSPADTVERAWVRGLETGRYKAVDDLLFHNIEAYTGMPQLFFSWINKNRQKIHVEFLDNNVPRGQRPRTIAYGWNGRLTVFDTEGLRRLERYRNINIEARHPADVQQDAKGGRDILMECVARIPSVIFADPRSLAVLGRTENGRCVYLREGFTDRSLSGAPLVGALAEPELDPAEMKHTIGAWSHA